MTALEWIAAGILDFVCSLAAFAVWTHFAMEERWDSYHIRREEAKAKHKV